MGNKDILLCGKKIALKLCTNDSWHEFYKSYVADPMMDTGTYTYDYQRVYKAYQTKTNDASRMYFSILLQKKVIGEIYLKHMNAENKTAEFGVALINDSVKGRGYGTDAINLLTDYAFSKLDFESVFADSFWQIRAASTYWKKPALFTRIRIPCLNIIN